MAAVKSGNVEWCGGIARRVEGYSFRDSESREWLSDMVALSVRLVSCLIEYEKLNAETCDDLQVPQAN
jgi:hypothetical protein